MTLTNGDHTIEYGMTPAGQMFERHKLGVRSITRTTVDTERFLLWMIQSEIDADVQQWLDKMKRRGKGGRQC